MKNLISHSKLELELAGLLSSEKDFYGGMTGKSVLELIELFSEQGHSGMSANIVADIFWKLANYKNLTPITGQEDEWDTIEGIDQNKRCLSLFRYPNGEIKYSSAIVFKDENGSSWTGSCWLSKEDCELGMVDKKLYSIQKIKEFPFIPTSFYVDVLNIEIGEESHSVIKDKSQLLPIMEYYIF